MAMMLPQSSPGYLIFGHRGAAGLAPENTLGSFARAVELGVDGIEMDVRLCGKRLVVIHDADVDRTTNGSGPVTDHSFSALRSLDAGCGETIPTLEEALDTVPREVMVNIELKGPGTGEPVAAIVRCLDGDRRARALLVSSFDYAELGRFRDLCPDVACAPLVSRWSVGLHATAAELSAWSVNLSDRVATAQRVTEVRSWGCRCLVYTVNDPERGRLLRSWGTDGLFTDFPDRFAPSMEHRTKH